MPPSEKASLPRLCGGVQSRADLALRRLDAGGASTVLWIVVCFATARASAACEPSPERAFTSQLARMRIEAGITANANATFALKIFSLSQSVPPHEPSILLLNNPAV